MSYPAFRLLSAAVLVACASATQAASPVSPSNLVGAVTSAPLDAARYGEHKGTPYVRGEIIVKYRNAAALISAKKANGYPLQLEKALGNGIGVFRADALRAVSGITSKAGFAKNDREFDGLLAALRNDPAIEYAQPNYVLRINRTVNDEFNFAQWDHAQYRLPQAWDITVGNAGQVVAVIDTGRRDLPDLAGKLLPGYDFVSDPAAGADGDGRDADNFDPGEWAIGENQSVFHGIAIAAQIGANTNNGKDFAGINWNTRILPVRVVGRPNTATIVDIADGIRWAAGLPVAGAPNNPNRARVINVSLGGTIYGSCASQAPYLQDAINAANSAGALVVASAGNASQPGTLNFPGACNNVLSVGALDTINGLARYSNYGPKVKVYGPVGNYYGPDGQTPEDLNGDGYFDCVFTSGVTADGSATGPGCFVGTSFAAPQVAGVASLMLAVNPNLTPAALRRIINTTSTPLGLNCVLCTEGGLLNAEAAVREAQRKR